MFRFFSPPWFIWLATTIGASIGLAWGLNHSEGNSTQLSKLYLPGETTSGHYQIELSCSACHNKQGVVEEQKCLDCHQADLKAARDTHPKSKFSDPTKIVLLEKIAADRCVTCHREHDAERTTEMGVTVPQDYCWHCHQDVAEDRPSHADFSFDGCLATGCHNYHDNTALYENFLAKHLYEPVHKENPHVVVTPTDIKPKQPPLRLPDADAPADKTSNEELMNDWVETAHAMHGVNCSACHEEQSDTEPNSWKNLVSAETCGTCHSTQLDTFKQGKHGMRLASGLSPMQPKLARQPMRQHASHQSLDCNSCHQGHRFDRSYAAVDACLKCHADDHSTSYKNSTHFNLWSAEQDGTGQPGSGVSCATCHMPRVESDSGDIEVVHNQNWNLQPNEKMVRTVCLNCHGLQYTLDSLASPENIRNCFSSQPSQHVESLEMVKRWFEEKRSK